MPNWCQNVVYISHEDNDKIDFIVEELGKKEPQLFNALFPRPADQEENWYDWNTSNWGTKWDASVYDHHKEEDGRLYISFDTAWGPPIGLYEFLYENGYDVEAFYNEEGMAFAGWFIDGEDNHYSYGDMSADDMEEQLPTKLDEMFNIIQYKRDWEDENEELEDEENDELGLSANFRFNDDQKTEWFRAKVKPVHEGLYEVKTKEWPFPQPAEWSNGLWYSFGSLMEFKPSEWRGLNQATHDILEEIADMKKTLSEMEA